jgi:hypothetical protein
MVLIFGLKPQKGDVVCGDFNLYQRADGSFEKFPVVLVSGMQDGPIVSISANLHGDEYTGTLSIHELIQDKNFRENLKGTVVFLPTLNPIGAIRKRRFYSFSNEDPNRNFPDEKSISLESKNFTRFCMKKLFLELKNYTSFHIDLHCSKLISNPFCYLRRDLLNGEVDKLVYQKSSLAVNHFGIPVVYNGSSNFDKIKNTFIGSLVYLAKIPGFTVELGSKKYVQSEHILTGVNGIKRTLKYLGVYFGDVNGSTLREDLFSGKKRVCMHPRLSQSGVIKFLVKPGDDIKSGDRVATINDLYGEKIGDGFVYTKYDAHVLCQIEGAFFSKNDSILKLAIDDNV